MQIKILYFAKLREQLGRADETLTLAGDAWTVGTLRAHLQARGGDWLSLAPGKATRAAVNQSMVDDAAAVPANAEVAFFPPVTGG
jgi:molybdopterin synthase sulfur carrier subunit